MGVTCGFPFEFLDYGLPEYGGLGIGQMTSFVATMIHADACQMNIESAILDNNLDMGILASSNSETIIPCWTLTIAIRREAQIPKSSPYYLPIFGSTVGWHIGYADGTWHEFALRKLNIIELTLEHKGGVFFGETKRINVHYQWRLLWSLLRKQMIL